MSLERLARILKQTKRKENETCSTGRGIKSEELKKENDTKEITLKLVIKLYFYKLEVWVGDLTGSESF